MKRRKALKSIAVGSLGTVISGMIPSSGFSVFDYTENQVLFKSDWGHWKDLKWVGPEFWGNRLQDWKIEKGKVICDIIGANRTLHLLTLQNETGLSEVEMEVSIDILNNEVYSKSGYVGFRIGATGPFPDYRSAAVFGKGIDIGINTEGDLIIGDQIIPNNLENIPDSFKLKLSLKKKNDRNVSMTIQMVSKLNDLLFEKSDLSFKPEQLQGNFALLAHFEVKGKGIEEKSFAFSDWKIAGKDLEVQPDQSFGPICFAQYTLHRKTLRLTAQCAPIENIEGHEISLLIKKNGQWVVTRTTCLENPGRAVNFVIENWEYSEAIPYRVQVRWEIDGNTYTYTYDGTIAKEPLDQSEINLAVFSCNGHMGFPDSDIPECMAKLKPDMVAFLGDQFYESTGGFGAVYSGDFDKSCLDYLRKWMMFGWSYRDVFRHIPCAIIPDDHDVYHGNVWGEGGKAADISEGFGAIAQDSGGYKKSPNWVNMVQYTQTSHLPAPYDPTPVKQGIDVYYTHWNYGGISFAIIEDRKFKSAPANVLPAEAEVRNGWIMNADFDIKKYNHLDAELLGLRQEKFLEEWVEDWSENAQMKAVLSQTNFAAVATLPEGAKSGAIIPKLPIPEKGEYVIGDRPTVDMDSNGWPVKQRNRAIEIIRKGGSFHIAGDQHLGSFIQYGIDRHGDAGFAFAGPAINNIWPRRFWPPVDTSNHSYDNPAYTGDHFDGFGNRVTVKAIANPHNRHQEPAILYNRAVGYGLVTFDKTKRTITTACFMRFVDPESADSQYPGWPITISQLDNYGTKQNWLLPTIKGLKENKQLIKVYDESGELVFALRVNSKEFQPRVFDKGNYNIEIIDDYEVSKVFSHITAKKENQDSIKI